MRTSLLVTAILLSATVAQGQNGPSQVAPPPATPPAPTPAPAKAPRKTWVDAALEKMAEKKPDGGEPHSRTDLAQQTLSNARASCTFVPKDEKLVAACDNSTDAGRLRLPRTVPGWQTFAGRLQDADQVVNGKRRGVIVMNGAEVMAEITASGVLVPRK
jgi:hypothetical protein